MKLSALLFCACALSLNGQTLVQSSIAAAGGSVAGVAGKKVSEGVDKVLGKVSEITSDAADTVKPAATEKKTRSLPRGAGIPKASTAVSSRAPLTPRASAPPPPRPGLPKSNQNIAATRRVKELDTVDAFVPPPSAIPTPVPERQPTAEDLQSLTTGATREQLADRMGKPSAKITMAEDGKLVEVYTYRNAGTVRMVDGTVADIRLK